MDKIFGPEENRAKLLQTSYSHTEHDESIGKIDQLVSHWSDLRQESVEKQAKAKAERDQFLKEFQDLTQAVIRPTMEAAVARLQRDGGDGMIEERQEDVFHRERLTLWMSLQGQIAGSPRQDLNPYLQLGVDAGNLRIDVWEGDMWERQGSSRATTPWHLHEVTPETVTKRILDILRRAGTHGVAA
jgi:hypothetical protein